MLSKNDPCLCVCLSLCLWSSLIFSLLDRFCWNLDHIILTKIWCDIFLTFGKCCFGDVSFSAVFQCGIITPSIATFSHFIDLMYWDRSGPKIPGCLCLCQFVCLSVCLFALERQHYRAEFDKTYKKWSPVCRIVCVCVSAHWHNSWHQGRHIRRKKASTDCHSHSFCPIVLLLCLWVVFFIY